MGEQSMKTQLLPCPFCGGEAKLVSDYLVDHWVECTACRNLTTNTSAAAAISAWNRRASPPAAVPDGWVMVPKEPTPEMLDAATPPASEWIGHPEARPESIERWRRSHREAAGDRYRVMISAAPAAPNGWQSISTAPKDGTHILVRFFEAEATMVAKWVDDDPKFPWQVINGERWNARLATHWQPLPAAPTEGSDE